MIRVLLPALLIGTPAMALEGLHHHPHGIEYGWVIAALVGVAAGLALAWWRK